MGQVLATPADSWAKGSLYKPLDSGSIFRFNKLGLDHLSLEEEPLPHQQVEEALSFTPLGSAPLDREPLLCVDLGTAHSAAVTGEWDPGTGDRRGIRLPHPPRLLFKCSLFSSCPHSLR